MYKFQVSKDDLCKVFDVYVNRTLSECADKINETIEYWLLNNYQRATGFKTRIDYSIANEFEIVYHHDMAPNVIIDYSLVYRGKFLSRLVITTFMRYVVENDDGFTDMGDI